MPGGHFFANFRFCGGFVCLAAFFARVRSSGQHTGGPARAGQGTRQKWARERMDEEGFERVVVAAVRLCFGIQSPVVLRDACGLGARDAEELAE